MVVATQVTMRVVVTTPHTGTPSLASELEPPPLPGTLTGTLLWSGTSVYEVDQAEHVVEGIRRLKHQMDDFSHAQTEMQASIDSQTSMLHDLFGHFRINPDA
jgi:hypothetical protein